MEIEFKVILKGKDIPTPEFRGLIQGFANKHNLEVINPVALPVLSEEEKELIEEITEPAPTAENVNPSNE